MSETQGLKVTSVATLKAYTEGQLVELPPFGEDLPFVAKLRRPSMLALARQGKIPNDLLNTATELFEGKSRENKVDTDLLRQLYDVIDILCEAAFVEPTYAEVKESGISLTDEQMIAVFNYTQSGVRALKPFRVKQ